MVSSELIVMSMQGLLDNGDEVLVPNGLSIDGSKLAGEIQFIIFVMKKRWYPDIDDIKSKNYLNAKLSFSD